MRNCIGKRKIGKTRNDEGLSMAKKKEKKETEKEESFDIKAEFDKLNPFIVDGFKKFIYKVKGAEVKTKKEFDKLLEEYGG